MPLTDTEKQEEVRKFVRDVLDPLQLAQARLQKNTKGKATLDNPEALPEVEVDILEDPEDIEEESKRTLEEEKADILDKLRKAKAFAEKNPSSPLFFMQRSKP